MSESEYMPWIGNSTWNEGRKRNREIIETTWEITNPLAIAEKHIKDP